MLEFDYLSKLHFDGKLNIDKLNNIVNLKYKHNDSYKKIHFPFYHHLLMGAVNSRIRFESTIEFESDELEEYECNIDENIKVQSFINYNGERWYVSSIWDEDYEDDEGNIDIDKRVSLTRLIPKLVFTIHFPFFIISNTNNEKRPISNLFVKFKMDKRGSIINSELHGLRTTFSYPEAQTGYIHSHLQSSGVFSDLNRVLEKNTEFKRFCLGNGTPVIANMALLQDAILSKSNIADLFELFLRVIETTVQHESLEGVPYIKIATVNNKEKEIYKRPNDPFHLVKYVNAIAENFSFSPTIISDIVTIKNNKLKITDDLSLLEKFILDEVPNSYYSEFLIMTRNGEIITDALPSISLNKYFLFNGVKYFFTIGDNTANNDDVIGFVLDKNFLIYAKQILEKRFNEIYSATLIEETRFFNFYKSANFEETSTPF
jgi:hypothetical protein